MLQYARFNARWLRKQAQWWEQYPYRMLAFSLVCVALRVAPRHLQNHRDRAEARAQTATD